MPQAKWWHEIARDQMSMLTVMDGRGGRVNQMAQNTEISVCGVELSLLVPET